MTGATTPDKAALGSWLPGFFALGAIWGSSFLFIKVGIREMHPVYVTLGRVGAGAITLLVVLAVLRDRLPRDPKLWLHTALYSAIGVALPFTLFGYGEQRVSSMLAGIWNATTPLVVLPLAVLVFRTERMTVRRGWDSGWASSGCWWCWASGRASAVPSSPVNSSASRPRPVTAWPSRTRSGSSRAGPSPGSRSRRRSC
ncbi:hypothetical protein GCM10027615_16130 [Plantactinospora veratri]